MTALEYLKSRTRNDALALIVNDDWAKRTLVAWTYHPSTWSDFLMAPSLSDKLAFKYAWKDSKVSHELLAKLTGLPPRLVRDKFEMLKTVGLIYPDGSANDIALRVIRNEIAAAIERTRAVG